MQRHDASDGTLAWGLVVDWMRALQRCFDAEAVYYTQHAKTEMENEEYGPILDSEIHEAIRSGELVEEYPDDQPYPSALIFGSTKNGRPLHTVCAYNEEEEAIIVITAYQPDPRRWIGFRSRRTT